MTPKTSDSPEAIRKRNIAAVRPPMNWLNRNDAAMRSASGAVPPLTLALRGLLSLPACGQREAARGICRDQASVHEGCRVDVFRVLNNRERMGRLLDHLAPELAAFGLVRFGVEGTLADRRIKAEAEQRLGNLVRVGAARLFDPLDDRLDGDVAHDRPARTVFGLGERLQMVDIRLVLGRLVAGPDDRIIGVRPDAVRVVGSERQGLVDRSDLSAVSQPVLDRFEIA